MTTLPQSRPLTVEDLDGLRDAEDGHRYELVDGSLIVTPAPRPVHQVVALAVATRLLRAVSPELRVLMAPVDVRLGEDTVLQPDVLVVRRDNVGERFVEHPVLAVEVLSPSTRDIDLGLKKARYERGGCAGYWVVDPEPPALTAWALRDGRYEQVAAGVGAEELAVPGPVSVTLRPAHLLE